MRYYKGVQNMTPPEKDIGLLRLSCPSRSIETVACHFGLMPTNQMPCSLAPRIRPEDM
jgi:hypothetical protein